MAMNNLVGSPLFKFANQLCLQENYSEALGIYELLTEIEPNFPGYAFGYAYTKNKLKEQGVTIDKFHFEKADEKRKRLRIADYLAKYKNQALIDACLKDFKEEFRPEMLLTLANAAAAQKDYDLWLTHVNRFLTRHGISMLSFKPKGEWGDDFLFSKISYPKESIVDGPLVTVHVSCFNAEKFITHAVDSLLNQTYRNLEIFLVNDQSTDNTLEICKQLAKKDKRITVLNNEGNYGPYVSRNRVLAQAKGEFFTVLDADDVALPDRIAMQVADLRDDPQKQGIVYQWLRVTADGTFIFRSDAGGKYMYEAVATLMFRTKPVREKVGYWDSVKFSADSEFWKRLVAVYGAEAVPLKNAPVTLSLFHMDSLTNDSTTGISMVTGLSPIRKEYGTSWRKWHKDTLPEKLYIPFPLSKDKRLFPAPEEMLSAFKA